MLKNIFPSLRRTEYKVDYTVRGFSLEEAVEVFKTRPQLLSLNELFAVANSYPIGSNEYNTVFETAARIYSNNPIANLNAANVAMSKGDMTSAYKYLNSAGNTPEAIHSQGIYYLLEGDFKNAENYLERAKLSGIKEAEVNLKIARNKLNP